MSFESFSALTTFDLSDIRSAVLIYRHFTTDPVKKKTKTISTTVREYQKRSIFLITFVMANCYVLPKLLVYCGESQYELAK